MYDGLCKFCICLKKRHHPGVNGVMINSSVWFWDTQKGMLYFLILR